MATDRESHVNDILLISTAGGFLVAGILLGLWLRRGAAGAAVAAARQESERQVIELAAQLRARDEALAEARRGLGDSAQALDAERGRVVALTRDLARATADAAGLEQRLAREAAEAANLGREAEALRAEVRRFAEDRARLAADLDAERKAAEERRAEAERTQQQVRAHVEKVAGDLVQQKGDAIVLRSKEGLEALLKPLGEKLKEFEAKVDKTFDTENRDRASLLESLRALQSTQEKLHKDAEALSKALARDSKQQGDWGELMLEKVLETAGLQAGRDFDLQVSHTDEEGRQKRPDAIVYLPQQRALVVDAKCSLTAFVEVARATDDAAREAALDAHVASLRSHVKNLAGKDYTRVLQDRSLDIVLLFVPNEAALLAALSRAPALYEEAFQERVVLTSPTTLFAAMKLIEHVWRSEKQSQGAAKIAAEAGKLLEKLSLYVEALDEVGERLGQAQVAFETARGRLAAGKGNVLSKAKKLMAMGATTNPAKLRNLLEGAAEGEEPEEDAPGGEAKDPGEG